MKGRRNFSNQRSVSTDSSRLSIESDDNDLEGLAVPDQEEDDNDGAQPQTTLEEEVPEIFSHLNLPQESQDTIRRGNLGPDGGHHQSGGELRDPDDELNLFALFRGESRAGGDEEKKAGSTDSNDVPPKRKDTDEDAKSGDGSKSGTNDQSRSLTSEASGSAEGRPPTRPEKLHQRTVSWGVNTIRVDNMPRHGRQTSEMSNVSSIQQPDLSEHQSSVGGAFLPPRASNRRRLPSVDQLNALDPIVINPLASEAEQLIIQAIEQRDPPRSSHDANVPPIAPIMSGISDEEVASLAQAWIAAGSGSTEGSVDEERSPTTDSGSFHSTTTPPPASSGSGMATQTPNSMASPPSVRRVVAPLSPRTTPPRAVTRLPQHRRDQTMEQQLFGLASALDAMHAQPPSHHGVGVASNLPRPRSGTVDSVKSPVNDLGHVPMTSSAEAFQQNASILVRRIRGSSEDKDKDIPDVNVGPVTRQDSSASGIRPSTLRGSYGTDTVSSGMDHKKSDDVILDNVQERDKEDSDELGDIESGMPRGDRESPDTSAESTNAYPGRFKTRTKKFTRDFREVFVPMERSIRLYVKVLFLYIIVPCGGISAILFYLAGNPPTGVLQNYGRPVDGKLLNQDGSVVDPGIASASWWLLFVVRQAVTLSMAIPMEPFLIDFLSIRSGLTYKLFGAWPTLFLLMARGWPFLFFFWGVFDFALLAGGAEFFSHWLFWQKTVGLCNASNPSGTVVDSTWNHRILAIVVSVSAAVAVKRFLLGLYLGKKTFLQYSDKLAAIMRKILLISEVAYLSRDIAIVAKKKGERGLLTSSIISRDNLEGLLLNADETENSTDSPRNYRSDRSAVMTTNARTAPVVDAEDRSSLTGKLNQAQKARIVQLLGAWEEPSTTEIVDGPVSVSALLQFRRAVACLRTDFPFSATFGPAGTREDTIISSQEVYEKLLLDSSEDCLNFQVLARIGVRSDGSLDQQKLVDLIKLFRPDRDGTLSMIDFVKSVDAVYRELRLLRASVNNSSKIDSAFENIFNIVFYFIILVIILGVMGLNPLEMFLAVTGVVLAFAFMIGPASSKYFEGLLFILVRRPYEIGDGIAISDPNAETSIHGSGWWLVKDVSLFTTTVVYVMTNELATLSNGSMANSRIINATRSPHATLFTLVKFPIDVKYVKLAIFKDAIEQFIRNRPREWTSMLAFRATRAEASEGFVEYAIAGEHRESWAQWGTLKNSLANLVAFSTELAKKLDIWYSKPPLPVNLSMKHDSRRAEQHLLGNDDDSVDLSSSPTSTGLEETFRSPDLRDLHLSFAPPKETKKSN